MAREHVTGRAVCVPVRTIAIEPVQLAEILHAALAAGAERVLLYPANEDGMVPYTCVEPEA